MLRTKYVPVIEAIARGESVTGSFGPHLIPADATRKQCLRYTLRHVVRHRQPHYRFDRYTRAARIALTRTTFGATGDGPIVHVDLGCGPGLFGWVVSDVFRPNRNDLHLYGFDHSREMIRLAADIWQELEETPPCTWHDNIADLLSALDTTPPHRHALVTFGHVLAQTHSAPQALAGFAQIIDRLMIDTCAIVAVDALSAGRKFRKGRDELVDLLGRRDLRIDAVPGCSRNPFVASVSREEQWCQSCS